MDNKKCKKTNLLCYLPILLLLAAIFYIMDYEIRKISSENEVSELERANNRIMSSIECSFFNRLEDMSKSLASDPHIIRLCLKLPQADSQSSTIVLNTAKALTGASICYVLDSEGTVLNATAYDKDKNLNIIGFNYSFRPYFKEAINGNDVSCPGISLVTGESGVYFCSPIYSESRKIIGVTVIRASLGSLDAALNISNYKSLLMTREGIVFSSSDPAWLYRYVPNISADTLDQVKSSKQFANTELKPLDFTIPDGSTFNRDDNTYILKTRIGSTSCYIVTIKKASGVYNLTPLQKRFIYFVSSAIFILFILIIISYINIMKIKNAEEQLKKLSTAVEQGPVSVVITDTNGTIEYVNEKFTQITGYTGQEVIGKNPRVLKTDLHPAEFYKELWDTITSGHEWKGEFCNKKKNGEIFWESAIISPIKNSRNTISHFVAIKQDITENKEIQEKLNSYATIDEMTGTLNRRTCMSFLQNLMLLSKKIYKGFVICFVDINGLKSVNDTFGHKSGDDLILSIVNVIKANIRESDKICRMGGDEFLVIFPDCTRPEADAVWSRIEKDLDKINSGREKPYILSIARGFAEYVPELELTIDNLINIADKEMYENKKINKQSLGVNGVLRSGKKP